MRKIQLTWTHLFETNNEGTQTLSLPINIGRETSNDLVLKSHFGYVSRLHAQLKEKKGQIVLQDRSSTNGTFVNERKVRKVNLQHGDTFAIGAYEITVKTLTQCNNEACHKHVDSDLQMCPWCGRFLAEAITKEGQFV